VVGVNLILGPDTTLILSSQRFLSPDSVCHSFDYRANGYARGEGCVALVLKPVLSAIQDGNTIRSIIRATGTNQDGKTPGLTQPSAEAQTALIREVYSKAGLDLARTRYIQAPEQQSEIRLRWRPFGTCLGSFVRLSSHFICMFLRIFPASWIAIQRSPLDFIVGFTHVILLLLSLLCPELISI
jgi:hypothetical protein